MSLSTVESVIQALPSPQGFPPLPQPKYDGQEKSTCKVGLAVSSMSEHMTDEGWQIFDGLRQSGYDLCGKGIITTPEVAPLPDLVDVQFICRVLNPDTVLVQDKREWDTSPRDFRDQGARFQNIEYLRKRSDIFKLTILKDAHQRPLYHSASALEMDCHAWIGYYHPAIVKHLAPYIRAEHYIRTYHTLDNKDVPYYDPAMPRKGCLLSGALSGAYPMRTHLMRNIDHLPQTDYLRHPGYHRNGCFTPEYLRILSQYKVAICTSSLYGYALRKIIEATACGCRVITNLPVDEVLPCINGNLIRVPSDIPVPELAEVIKKAIDTYDPANQSYFVCQAVIRYNYRDVTRQLAKDIETLRLRY